MFARRTGRSATALSGPWHIINNHSGKCLTIRNISTADNAQAVQWTCDYSAPYNEEWVFEYLGQADDAVRDHICNNGRAPCGPSTLI